MANVPRGREKHVTEGGAGVHRRGSGLGTGPVGDGSFHGSPRPGSSGPGGPGGSGGFRGSNRGPGGSLIAIIIAVVVFLLGGGGAISHFGGSDAGDTVYEESASSTQDVATPGFGSLLSALLSGPESNVSMPWGPDRNVGVLDSSVAEGARDKYTVLKGKGQDVVTVMVYMCGTDLESKSGMATNDLKEMSDALISDQVNLIVYTGGCKSWNNAVVSSSKNQIYEVRNGGLRCLESDMGSAPMTDPDTLSGFIKYCAKNYPADRNMLIFWDHGGGSVSGYGYDEKNPNSGSMTLSGINKALKDSGIKYDIIGFDACLMATIETDLMAASYGDYLIASEETEPGVGWYYTDWLTKLSENTSMPSVEIGKKIADDFVKVCATTCGGQKTTLSVVDLAELSATVPEDFKAFATDTKELIQKNEYKTVSDARSSAREFAASSRIDQIDLVHFANCLGTPEASALAESLLGAVKYNNTSQNITNAYGISIYFPYQKTSNVDKATKTYDEIGLDGEYSDCIRAFAKMEVSGQAATGGTQSPFSLLSGNESVSAATLPGASDITSMLSMLSSGSSLIEGLTGANTDFFSDRAVISDEDAVSYVENNLFDESALTWRKNDAGEDVIALSDEQIQMIHSIELQMYYDDGNGFVDLGRDSLYSVDEDGNLVADVDGTWLSVNGQPVMYYHMDTVEEGDDKYTITGYIPALLNGQRVKLIVIFDDENPKGYFAGAQPEYDEDTETQTVARGLLDISVGDTIDFLCDYYGYDGSYQDTYFLGDQVIVSENMEISNTALGGSYQAMYRFTDIYNQQYWSDVLKR